MRNRFPRQAIASARSRRDSAGGTFRERIRVVAKKIRTLAMQVRLATKKIRTFVERIRVAAKRTRTVTSQVRLLIKKIRTLAERIRTAGPQEAKAPNLVGFRPTSAGRAWLRLPVLRREAPRLECV